MVDRWEAMTIAAPWVHQGARPGVTPTIAVSEFELGFVLWRVPPDQERDEVGAGRVVVNRQTGELTYWPSIAVEAVAEEYRAFRRDTPAPPLTWDPLVRARHDRLRAPFPDRVTHLELAGGGLRLGRSMKGEGTANLHPLVREALAALAVVDRVRGNDRCSEIAALSDLLHAETSRRSRAGEPPLTVADVRDSLLRGASLVSYEVREWADPLDGQSSPPCRSCQAVLRRFGFGPQPGSGERL